MKANGFATRRSRRSGTSWCRSPTTPSTRRTPPAYGLVSYWTAYLKANYPAEYMAALLTSVGDDKDKSALYLNECRRMGIKVLPPDVNESIGQLRRRRHRHPLRPRRGPQRRRQRRRRDRPRPRGEGPLHLLHDFLRKVPAVVCNKRTIESLIKAGAFDSLRPHPPGAGARSTRTTSTPSSTVKRKEAIGQDSPVRRRSATTATAATRSTSTVLPPIPTIEWDKADAARVRARDARPLRLRPPAVRPRARPRPARRHLDRRADRRRAPSRTAPTVTVAGLITGLQRKMTKKGNPWAIATVEDLDGAIECLFFPQAYLTVSHDARQDLVVRRARPAQPARRRPRRSTPRS